MVAHRRIADGTSWVEWEETNNQTPGTGTGTGSRVETEGSGEMWGWSEQMGWEMDESKGLVELDDGDGKYRLGVGYDDEGIRE